MVRRTHQICPKRAECETRLTALSLCLNMEPHKHQSQDDPYFQSSIARNRLWSGSPGSQWVCCPPFGAKVHVSGQKWSNLQGIYQECPGLLGSGQAHRKTMTQTVVGYSSGACV